MKTEHNTRTPLFENSEDVEASVWFLPRPNHADLCRVYIFCYQSVNSSLGTRGRCSQTLRTAPCFLSLCPLCVQVFKVQASQTWTMLTEKLCLNHADAASSTTKARLVNLGRWPSSGSRRAQVPLTLGSCPGPQFVLVLGFVPLASILGLLGHLPNRIWSRVLSHFCQVAMVTMPRTDLFSDLLTPGALEQNFNCSCPSRFSS